MNAKKLTLGLALAAASLVSLNSFAGEADDKWFEEARTVKMMDKNKDGMVSKAEFLEMAGKMFEMKAKAMGSKDGKMTEAMLKDFYKALYGGGN
jgi:uncharacterized protein (DUF2141 family)